MNKWKKYYELLLTEDRQPFLEEEDVIYNEETDNVDKIDIYELNGALEEMKNGKASGPGNIPIELIKAAPSILKEILVNVFNKCLLGDTVPEDWKLAYITSIYKKGNRENCSNYRGISVTSSIGRLYGRILKKRLEKNIRVSEEQNGFTSGRSCIDGVFTLKQLTEKRTAHGEETHLTFVDLQKAYDTVPLNKLWNAMRQMSVNEIYITAIKNLYQGCYSMVKIKNVVSERFKITKGLKQGCCIAPTLFKIYLDEALINWKRKCSKMGIPVGDDILYTLFFADDQVVIAGDEDDATYMMRKLIEQYEEWGLQVNLQKTEHLVIGGLKTDLKIDNTYIKGCNTFKYLGVSFTNEGTSKQDIRNKIGQGRRAIKQLNSVLWSNKITKRTKHNIYHSIVESITTYGSEVWEISKPLKQRLTALEMDYWRRSCNISRLQHIRNEEIREKMNVKTTIIDTIENKRLRWFGHLQRMENNRWPKKLWEWKPQKKKKRGRPRKIWTEEVKEAMDSRGLSEGDWNDRRKWKLGIEKRRQP